MYFDVEQAAILPDPYRGRAGHRRQELALLDDAQPARPFGDEEAAVGKEGDAPRRFEILGEDFELDRLLFGLEDGALRIDLGLGLALELTGLIANVEDELPDLFLGDEVLERHHRRARASVTDACRDARVVAAELPVLVHEARGGAALEGRPMTGGAELRDQPRGRIAATAASRTGLSGATGRLRRRRPRGWGHCRGILGRWRILCRLQTRHHANERDEQKPGQGESERRRHITSIRLPCRVR